MTTNDPGRDPEPTDAETKNLQAALSVRMDGGGTVRDYFRKLLETLWTEAQGFSGKRPFGNSDWQYDVYVPLIREGFIDGLLDDDGDVEIMNELVADKFILRMIAESFNSCARPIPDTPAPVPGNECEHAQLARDVFEEAVRLQARIAELEADLAAAKADAESWEKQADDRAGDAVNFATRVADLERDLKTAAGDFPVEMPEPGTPMAILLSANVLLKRENAALGAERDGMKESCRIVLGFGKAIISDASINGILDGAPTTLLFQTVDEEHTIGMDATGYGRDNLEPGDGNVQIVFTKAESVDVVIDTLVKIKGAIESAVSAGKEAPDAE